MNQLTSYLPMLVLTAGALLVFTCGALAPTRGALFRSIALVSAAASCLAALALPENAAPALIDSGPYARFFTLLITGLTFLTLLFASEYAKNRDMERDEFHALILLAGLGMVMLAVATDWIMFATALETFSLALYVLIASRRDKPRPLEAAVKYFVLGAVASAMAFLGMAFLYAASGTLAIAPSLTSTAAPGTTLLGLGFILTGLALKLSLAPLHLWTPDVYQGAPAPVAAFLSGGGKVAVFAALLRMALTDSPAWQTLEPILWTLAALSMAGGTLGALTQPSFKRMLGYSSTAHVGYLLLALMAAKAAGPGPALFAAAAFGIMDVAAFGCLGLLSPADDDADPVKALRGLGLTHSGPASALAASLLTLAGLPPSIGFISKLVIFKAALTAGYLWLSVIGIAMAIVGVFYILRVLTALYAKPKGEPAPIAAPGFCGWLAIVLSLVLTLGLGVIPAPVLDAAALTVRMAP